MFELPKNNYQAPTEIREEVIERLCTTLLNGREFNPDMYFRGHVHKYVQKAMSSYNDYPFEGEDWFNYPGETRNAFIRFHSCEIRKALRMCLDAGYYVWYSRYNGNTKMYVTRKPTPHYSSSRPITQSDIDAINID